ncbi:MAG: fluoride efflux transporter CrcB [Muribaculaceae bacterium]|nr:fluoride efflux transporter CrcB [Muribaculaceae bacterium]
MNGTSILAVFIGSGLGGVCRYVLSRFIQSNVASGTIFPWGTFWVNIIGCFIIGLCYGYFNRYAASSIFSPQVRLILTVGFCGGFTTFSTFINENYLLFQSSNVFLLCVYVAASVLLGFALLYAGYVLSQL